MPIKKSAMKALKQSHKKAISNFKVKRKLKELIKESKELLAVKDKEAAAKVKQAVKAIDKAIQKKIIKKNSGAKKKSKLMKRINLLAR
jgi:small subunit ribosomal protein S20